MFSTGRWLPLAVLITLGCEGPAEHRDAGELAVSTGALVPDGGACAKSSDCAASSWCHRPPYACSGHGVCAPRPTLSQAMNEPIRRVCGCDGKKYLSPARAARYGGTSVAHEGSCEDRCSGLASCASICPTSVKCVCDKPVGECGGKGVCKIGAYVLEVGQTVCGCSGTTWLSSHKAHLGDDSVHSFGPCLKGGEACSSASGPRCETGLACNTPPGRCDAQGTCVLIGVPFVGRDPVCGCDGASYFNPDMAKQKSGVGVAHQGPCGTGCTDNRDCSAHCAGPEYLGACYCEKVTSNCGPGSPGHCQRVPKSCPPGGSPVCACDGTTQESACHAAKAGQSVYTPFPCAELPEGALCPSPDGLECAAGLYCNGAPGACGEPGGRCTKPVDVCSKTVKLVCGCDGETYQNECKAHKAGTDVDYLGACPRKCHGHGDCEPELLCVTEGGGCGAEGRCLSVSLDDCEASGPVCGCDGRPYANECVAYVAGAMVHAAGDCSCDADADCPTGAHCRRPFGACDGPGFCSTLPSACPAQFTPVCDCEGASWANPCLAWAAGKNIAAAGECPNAPTCTGNGDCLPDELCAKAPGACGATGFCSLRPTACPLTSATVCGCDGSSWLNACQAAAAGVTVAKEGPCADCESDADCPNGGAPWCGEDGRIHDPTCDPATGDCKEVVTACGQGLKCLGGECVPGTCTYDHDCPNGGAPACLGTTGRVRYACNGGQCVALEEVCVGGTACDHGECVPAACASDADCPGGGAPFCTSAKTVAEAHCVSHACVVDDGPCPAGTKCVGGACEIPCKKQADCKAPGTFCKDGLCRAAACSSDADCPGGLRCAGAGSPAAACVECLSASDCPGGCQEGLVRAAVCDGGVCGLAQPVDCGADRVCVGEGVCGRPCGPALPCPPGQQCWHLGPGLDLCLECTSDAGCPGGGAPFCDGNRVATSRCVEQICSTVVIDDCTKAEFVCHPDQVACVPPACFSDAACDTPLVCIGDPPDSVCGECRTDADCKASRTCDGSKVIGERCSKRNTCEPAVLVDCGALGLGVPCESGSCVMASEDCCRPHDAPLCEGGPGTADACLLCVCEATDPAAGCCTGYTPWVAECAQAAATDCATACGCARTCCEPHAAAGCTDPGCSQCVCAADPSCCTGSWHAGCVTLAAGACAGACACPGSACEAHVAPSSDDPACSACVCGGPGGYPECCDQGWNLSCVARAAEECDAACGCGAGCCAPHGTAGCADGVCEACVCAALTECCAPGGAWTAACADRAATGCAAQCGCAGACCDDHPAPGCDVPSCETCVCLGQGQTSCCTDGWDPTCAATARAECAASCPCEGPCCEEHGTPGCAGAGCEACVCAARPACCEPGAAWTAECVALAAGACAAECDCAGPCCGAHDAAGCDGTACEECVCWEQGNVECCTGAWTPDCADVAAAECTVACGCKGPCCQQNPTAGCEKPLCEACVCAAMPECCTGAWTAECADLAGASCAAQCGCAGTCCQAHPTPGCDDAACKSLICGLTPSCCASGWTSPCASLALDLCACEGFCMGPADCDDLDSCTANACVNGQCTYTPAVACNTPPYGYGLPGTCTASKCVYTPLTGPCNDTNACTSGDTWIDGKCVGTPIMCDDGDPETTESCSPTQGGCVYQCPPCPPSTCKDSATLVSSACDTKTGQCKTTEQACPQPWWQQCVDGACIVPCAPSCTSAVLPYCKSATTLVVATACDTTNGQCLETTEACPAGTTCDPVTRACQKACSEASDCFSVIAPQDPQNNTFCVDGSPDMKQWTCADTNLAPGAKVCRVGKFWTCAAPLECTEGRCCHGNADCGPAICGNTSGGTSALYQPVCALGGSGCSYEMKACTMEEICVGGACQVVPCATNADCSKLNYCIPVGYQTGKMLQFWCAGPPYNLCMESTATKPACP
ncbi:MAG: hypothetical protein AMXMBFR64_41320 [Myxococcales bacterium]